jgi:hypothetical protein
MNATKQGDQDGHVACPLDGADQYPGKGNPRCEGDAKACAGGIKEIRTKTPQLCTIRAHREGFFRSCLQRVGDISERTLSELR